MTKATLRRRRWSFRVWATAAVCRICDCANSPAPKCPIGALPTGHDDPEGDEGADQEHEQRRELAPATPLDEAPDRNGDEHNVADES